MSCPCLTEVTMAFCRASPVRKYVPADRLNTASRCESANYQSCPFFRESLEGEAAEIREYEAESSHVALPEKKGVGRS